MEDKTNQINLAISTINKKMIKKGIGEEISSLNNLDSILDTLSSISGLKYAKNPGSVSNLAFEAIVWIWFGYNKRKYESNYKNRYGIPSLDDILDFSVTIKNSVISFTTITSGNLVIKNDRIDKRVRYDYNDYVTIAIGI